jgi:hypothetical protein
MSGDENTNPRSVTAAGSTLTLSVLIFALASSLLRLPCMSNAPLPRGERVRPVLPHFLILFRSGLEAGQADGIPNCPRSTAAGKNTFPAWLAVRRRKGPLICNPIRYRTGRAAGRPEEFYLTLACRSP